MASHQAPEAVQDRSCVKATRPFIQRIGRLGPRAAKAKHDRVSRLINVASEILLPSIMYSVATSGISPLYLSALFSSRSCTETLAINFTARM